MSRHTTSFTTNPMYRARNEVRNRLERLGEEAETTAKAMGEFPGNELEQEMWQMVQALCQGYVISLTLLNDLERENKTRAASAARRPVGHSLEQDLST